MAMPLLDSNAVLSPIAFAVGPTPGAEPTLISLPGASLLHAPRVTPAAAEAALKSLRGFRVTARRVVWCNPTELSATPNVDLRAWGRKFVETGGAELVVVQGTGARDLAVAARDAGLPLSRVVVCRDDATARNVLCDSLAAGDAVLALGVAGESCQRFAERLESRFERELLVGAGK
jgi:hypothetical protein